MVLYLTNTSVYLNKLKIVKENSGSNQTQYISVLQVTEDHRQIAKV